MPLTPAEIMLAKIWANALVILVAATFALLVIVQGLLGVPIAGSLALFVLGLAVYLFSLDRLGILLATLARTMPQFGLLSIPVFLVMYMLSGANTPLDAMPELLQRVMLPLAHHPLRRLRPVRGLSRRRPGSGLAPPGRNPRAWGPGLRRRTRALPADGESHSPMSGQMVHR